MGVKKAPNERERAAAGEDGKRGPVADEAEPRAVVVNVVARDIKGRISQHRGPFIEIGPDPRELIEAVRELLKRADIAYPAEHTIVPTAYYEALADAFAPFQQEQGKKA